MKCVSNAYLSVLIDLEDDVVFRILVCPVHVLFSQYMREEYSIMRFGSTAKVLANCKLEY